MDARKIYDSPHAIAVVITLQPGEALKKHMTPVDVFFYVLEGTGIVEIGDEKKAIGKDMLVESPARIPHRWINESSSVIPGAGCQSTKANRGDKTALKFPCCRMDSCVENEQQEHLSRRSPGFLSRHLPLQSLDIPPLT